MKRVGVITILKVENYGAELQAYATQAILKKNGYDAEIIDYLFYKNPNHIPTTKSRPLFTFGFRKQLSERLYPIIKKIKEYGLKEANLKRKERFDSFHARYTSLSPTYRTIEELYENPGDYDVYITGSDQVWNPGINSSLLPYFLDFVPEDKVRISYASSFGVSELSEKNKSIYKKYLSKYKAIGVREKRGESIVGDLGLSAVNVLDPTLLLNKSDWNEVAAPVQDIPEKYILVYELTPSSYLRKVSVELALRSGLPIVRICKSANVEDKMVVNIIDAGPSEFLWLVRNASFVVTNSFHGTAFSINFEIPFWVITPARKDNNSRQRNLLSLLGLEKRLLTENMPLPTELELNFDIARKRLADERVKSINFLKTAIDGE